MNHAKCVLRDRVMEAKLCREWNKVCDGIEKAWYAKVIISGLARKKQLEWATNHGRKN